MATPNSFARIQQPPVPQLVPQDWNDNKINLGFVVLSGYLFLLMSRAIEFVPGSESLHLMMVGAIAASVLAIVSGGFFQAMGTKGGIWLTASTIWMILGAPFSVWVGGSVTGLVNMWLKNYLVFFLVAGLLTRLPECRRLALVIASSAACIVVIAYQTRGESLDAGRLTAGGGTLGNSNDLATQILICLPFCIHVMTDKRRKWIVRIFFALVSAAALITTLQTSSRGALISIMVLIPMMIWKSSGAARIGIIVATLVALIAIPFVLTPEMKARYVTLFAGDDYIRTLSQGERDTIASAEESTEARRRLMQHAFELSLQHPVFGVGFGEFTVADSNRAGFAGEEADWHEIHNEFIRILVEDGLPALIFFLISLGYTCFQVFRIYNRRGQSEEDKEISRIALALMASLIAFFVCANFSPSSYSFQYPVLGGFVATLNIIVAKRRSAPAATVVASGPVIAGRPRPQRVADAPAIKPVRKTPVWRP